MAMRIGVHRGTALAFLGRRPGHVLLGAASTAPVVHVDRAHTRRVLTGVAGRRSRVRFGSVRFGAVPDVPEEAQLVKGRERRCRPFDRWSLTL
ncbi:hypothetical protein [Arthrobacter sp. MDT1-65]